MQSETSHLSLRSQRLAQMPIPTDPTEVTSSRNARPRPKSQKKGTSKKDRDAAMHRWPHVLSRDKQRAAYFAKLAYDNATRNDEWKQEASFAALPKANKQYLQAHVYPFQTEVYGLQNAHDVVGRAASKRHKNKWVRWTMGNIERTNPKNAAHDNDVLIITFPGTDANNPHDLVTDVDAKKVPLKRYGHRPVKVHEGFQDRFEDARKTVDGILEQARQASKDGKLPRNIQVMGHSLGGALAQLCVLYLQQDERAKHSKIQSLVFDAPPLGDKQLAKFFRNKDQYNFHRKDSPVARARGGLSLTQRQYRDLGLHSPVKNIEIDYSPESKAMLEAMDKVEAQKKKGLVARGMSDLVGGVGNKVLGKYGGVVMPWVTYPLDAYSGKQSLKEAVTELAILKAKNALVKVFSPHDIKGFAFGHDWQHTADKASHNHDFAFGLTPAERELRSATTDGNIRTHGLPSTIRLSHEDEVLPSMALSILEGAPHWSKKLKTAAGAVRAGATNALKAAEEYAMEYRPPPGSWAHQDPLQRAQMQLNPKYPMSGLPEDIRRFDNALDHYTTKLVETTEDAVCRMPMGVVNCVKATARGARATARKVAASTAADRRLYESRAQQAQELQDRALMDWMSSQHPPTRTVFRQPARNRPAQPPAETSGSGSQIQLPHLGRRQRGSGS